MKICALEAKKHGEFDFEVKKGLAPQKLTKKLKNLFPDKSQQHDSYFRVPGRRGDFFSAYQVGEANLLPRGRGGGCNRGRGRGHSRGRGCGRGRGRGHGRGRSRGRSHGHSHDRGGSF